ncbi:hypothetical protein SAMN05444162_1788 [Paenibacillaceae bacterium GAS479]|nr:hypothetical protein SAMN05444162_1788 [Paenibacillaceae bacterium GAS479]
MKKWTYAVASFLSISAVVFSTIIKGNLGAQKLPQELKK